MFPWREVLLEVALVRDPDVVPQVFMVSAERPVSGDASPGGDVDRDVAPDPDVEVRKCFRVQEADEVDEEEIGAWEGLGICQGACGPVEAAERAGPLVAQRFQDFCDETGPVHAVPVRGSLMRTGRIEEVVAAKSHRTGE